jgi:predicted hydrocarbon binding protein
MFKRLRQEKTEVQIDEDKGHLFLGDPKKDIKLLMLRPIDILEFCEFAGTNADDIIIWTGKTIGKELVKKYFYEKDWSEVDLASRKETFKGVLEGLAYMGHGFVNATVKKDHILVNFYNPLSEEEEDNIMAKNLCLLNRGIINGILEVLEFEVEESEEVECVLLEGERCQFKFNLFDTEFPEELIDEEKEPEAISDFLTSL